jgi:hypothetical protein
MIRFTKEPPGKFRRHYKDGETVQLGRITELLLIKEGRAVEIQQETIESIPGGLQPDNSDTKPRKAKSKNRKQ